MCEIDYTLIDLIIHDIFRETERLMGQFSWDGNQEVILLGVRKAGQHLIDNVEHQQRLTKEQANKLIKIGETFISKYEICQENHLEDRLNFLINL